MSEVITKIESGVVIDDELIKKLCIENSLVEGTLIITRYGDRKETRMFYIEGKYRTPIYKNKLGKKKLFR